MDALWHDFRAVRSLAKARGFAAVAIVVFALGVGINTALFSLTNALFFRPLPVERPEELVYLYDVWDGRPPSAPVGPRTVDFFQEQARDVFTAVAGHWPTIYRLTVDNQTELTRGEQVTGNFFELLGVPPQLGRTLTAADGAPAAPAHAIVIGDRLWERRFKRDPTIIGTRVRLCCRQSSPQMRDVDPVGELEIVGVMPASFGGVTQPGSPAEFWVSETWPGGGQVRFGTAMVARLADGVTLTQARAAVRQKGEVLLDNERRDAPAEVLDAWRGRYFDVYAAGDVFNPLSPAPTALQRQIAALTVVVTIVLLIAASNVAGLLIARGANRTAETAVRLVLGAGRLRIARLQLAESLVLSAAGGLVGLVIAFWLLELFHAYAPQQMAVETPFDIRVLGATAAMCVFVALLSGLTPALRSARVHLPAVLPGSSAGLTPSRRHRAHLRRFVLIPQVALALALLVIAGFHVRALVRTELADPGYVTDDRVTLNVGLRAERGDRGRVGSSAQRARRSRDFYRQVIPRLETVAGVAGVAVAGDLPLAASLGGSQTAVAEDDVVEGRSTGLPTLRGLVSPGYFRTMGIRIISGRDFDDRDVSLEGPGLSTIVPAPLTAILSESLARTLWDGRDAIGRRVAILSTWSGNAQDPIDWLEVIGVVEDVSPIVNESDTPYVYLPLGQMWEPYAGVVVAHVTGDPQTVTSALTQAVAGAHLAAEVYQARTLNQIAAELLFQTRFMTGILAAAGFIGLLLASVGLYGVIAYSVARRIRELGVRCALGASRGDIIGLVMKEGAVVTAAGTALGGVLAWAALSAGVNTPIRTTVDITTVAVVPVVLAAAVLLACYIPARRAARVDPLESLRTL